MITSCVLMRAEQFRGAAQPASDLYGLGGTLLYLLTGARPPSPLARLLHACASWLCTAPA